MKNERLLQVTSALCVALGTILLGMGQRDMSMAVLAIIATVLSVWVTDITGLFHLNRWVASVIAIGASILAFRQSLPLNSFHSIIALAGLLVYLELILLFQKKNHRVYWQLLVLSLLQVVVSTLLSQGAQFGLMMIVFMFVALLDLALLNLYAESLKASGHFYRTDWRGDVKEHGEISRPRIRVLIRRDLFRQVFRMGLMTLALTAVMFFLSPRLGRPAWRGDFFGKPRSVGFTDRIELGQLGSTVNDPAEVLRLKLIDPKTNIVSPMEDEIYLHGTVLSQYRSRHWSNEPDPLSFPFQRGFHRRQGWSSGPFAGPFAGRYPGRYVRRPYRRSRETGWYTFFPDLYRKPQSRESEVYPEVQEDVLASDEKLLQDIVIEPLDRRELFGVRPYTLRKRSTSISYDKPSERLLRSELRCDKRFRYQLYTTGIANKTQRLFYAAEEEVEVDPLLQYPDGLPTVVETAERWIREANLEDSTSFDKALHITKQFSDPTLFSYKLNSRRSDFAIDPVEDFVKNKPEGHCEYFASALAMMLRSQGIPCRLVVGFKCDEYDPIGKFYRVRQLHAHAWVEALFSAKEIGMRHYGDERWKNGVWYRLEPTSSSGGSSSEPNELLIPLAKLMNWFEMAWDNYVMDMDRTRQKTAIYQPIVNWIKNTYRKVIDPGWWIEVLQKIKPMLDPRNWNTEKWISWRGGLVGVAIMLTMVVFFYVARWFYRPIARRVRRMLAEKRRRQKIEVEFYRRFLQIALRGGLSRKRGETPREFAAQAGPRLAQTAKNPELEPLPAVITDAYYQIRFGQYPLDKARQEEIELAVGQLEAAMR